MVDRAVRTLREGGCEPVVAVLGAWVGDVPDAEVTVNDQWQEGMGSSLRVGLAYLSENPGVTSVIITLVDIPGMTSAAIRRLVTIDAPLAVATYRGENGHPVRIDRDLWPKAMSVAVGDQGARRLLADSSDVVWVAMDDVSDGRDLDSPTD